MNYNTIISKCKFVITIIIMMLGSLSAFADDVDETFQFMDKDGNIIADGTELVCKEVEDLGFGPQISTGLFVKNNSTDEKVLAKVQCVIEEIPDNSSIQCYFPANCMMFNQGAGTYSNGPPLTDRAISRQSGSPQPTRTTNMSRVSARHRSSSSPAQRRRSVRVTTRRPVLKCM